ncbi:MAG TPA: 2-C-methyl-D-erythritol 2,4-cyclodiphosphate synthase [Rhodocyclaceae bacterium]|nr:2-C-methyl-D-erythritol 2,4-cyclodiphosphate synthase [Rhodocyclaceae bacterium]
MLRIGQGFDVHALAPGRRLVLGGVEIPFSMGLLGHSDADVLVHAITDACLGAAGLGDIGQMFPDTNPDFRDANSRVLLRAAMRSVFTAGFRVVNLDATVIAQAPKLAPYVAAMKANLADDLHIDARAVGIKGKTTEKLGLTGRGEGIAAMAVVLLEWCAPEQPSI